MWQWSFEYPNGIETNELTLPLNKAVVIKLKSLDVIHSLYIPSFRIKEDVMPGKNNFMWFIPEQLGSYDIMCTEYCGLRHSYMESRIHILTQHDFDQWYSHVPKKKTEPEGLVIIKKNACTGCHSLDGSKLVSVSFKGLYGKKEKTTDHIQGGGNASRRTTPIFVIHWIAHRRGIRPARSFHTLPCNALIIQRPLSPVCRKAA